MRVLYLCHRIPYPPTKGEKIRAYRQLEAIGQEHEVDLFTLAEDRSDLAHQDRLLEHCRTVTVAELNRSLSRIRALPYLFTDIPLTLPCFRSGRLLREVRRALATRSYDRIFVYSSSMAQYVAGATDIPIVTDLVDVDSDKWRQYAGFASFPRATIYQREAICLRNVERFICSRSERIIVTTDREARLVLEISPAAPVHVIPNGVDLEHFRIPNGRRSLNSVILFTGDMSYFPNQEAVTYFATEVFPLVRQTAHTADFVIVGRNPNRRVQRLQRIPGVRVTGYVDDVRPYFADAAVAVAPFAIAAGIQNKILEAMASGLPVAGTSRAVQGLTPAVAELVAIGDSPRELANRVLSFLRDPAKARRRGIEARARLSEDYDWRRNLDALLGIAFPSASSSITHKCDSPSVL